MHTRRAFLFDSTAAVAAAALTPVSILAGPVAGSTQATGLGDIALADFERSLGESFVVRQGETAVGILELVRVELPPVTPRSVADAGNEKFTLLFRGAAGLQLSQDTYEFVHGGLGRFEMFIGPLPSTESGPTSYEAIFNRARPARSRRRWSGRGAGAPGS